MVSLFRAVEIPPRSDHHSFAHPPSASSSPSASKAHSMNQDFGPQPSCTTALNILFVGETNIGQSSIIDLVAGPGYQKKILYQTGRHDGMRNIALDGKTFTLHATPTNESLSTAAIKQSIQDTLMDFRKIGGVHLLVYCMNALHSIKWIHEIYRTIASSTPYPRVPAVAVVVGISDVARQERWWSSNEAFFDSQGLRFEHYAFIQMMTSGAQPPTGDDVSQSRRTLHELILQNYARALDSGANLNPQRTAPYKYRSMGDSFQSLPLARKPPSQTSTSPKDIAIVLLGETGVGKSSLVNLIARERVAEVSSDTVGCTKTIQKYSFEDRGRTIHFYDTPGLVDPLMDVECFIAPIDAIQKLIRSLGDGNGPDLLLFCIDKPTAALKRNCCLFCKVICGGDVSFAFAITKLEDGHDANEWWNRHGGTVRQYGIDRSRCIVLEREKERSGSNAERLRNSLLAFLVAQTDRPRNKIAPLRSLVGSMTAFLRSKFSTPERILMNECELEERTARELLSRIAASPRVSYDVGSRT